MTLRQYLEENNPDVQTRCLLLTQLLEGVVHLRNHGIAHRDIKSDNLFLDLTGMSIVQSVPITTKVASSDPIHGEVYWLQHYVIKVCQEQWFPPPIKMIATI